MQRAKYEQTVLRELRKILLNPNKQPRRREEGGLAEKIRVEEVRLETSELEHKVVILFRDLDRPQCLFGYEMEAIEWHDPGYDLRFLDPEIWTTNDLGQLSRADRQPTLAGRMFSRRDNPGLRA